MKGINKFRKIIKTWGGKIVCLTDKDVPEEFQSPFNVGLGCDYENKIIFYVKNAVEIWELIHEAGHIFASRQEPNKTDEKVFLAWEWAMGNKLQIPFEKYWNHVDEFSYDKYIKIARSKNLISKSNEPLSVRN